MIFCLKHPARVMTVLCRKLSVTLFMVFFAVLATASPTMDPGIEALQKKVGFTVIERFSTPVALRLAYLRPGIEYSSFHFALSRPRSL